MDYTPKQGLQRYSSEFYDTPDNRSDIVSSSYSKRKQNEPFTFNSDNIDDLKAGTANILVAVRCRPLSQKESSISDMETIGVVEDRVVVLREPPSENDGRESSRGPRREKNFTFDHFFDQKVSNLTIHERCTRNLIPGVVGGYNGTVFAYGATGAGKTYTMMGSSNNPGIMSFTLQDLFQNIAMKQDGRNLIVKISFFEVYNEMIIDLLGDRNSNLDIREDSEKGVFVLGITEYSVNSEDEVMRYLKIGSKNRTMEATSANEVSSRSHAILQVSIEAKSRTEGNSQETNYSKLSLIDLAGSERAAATKNTGIRLTEGANINKSLLALSNCITMLIEKLDKGLKSIHIPYRDSKLTRLLKDSLGGNCRTVMIANVSPAAISYDDTNNTLKFADKAKKIKTNLKKKTVLIESDVDKYTKIITQLQAENENLRKLLKEQQMNASVYSNIGPRQYSSNSGTVFDGPTQTFSSNEAMIQEIQSHFEYEMKAYKKLFDLEIIHDEYFLKIKEITQELGQQENLELRDELSHLITFQRNVLLQIKTARHEADIMNGRRDRLYRKVSEEVNQQLRDKGLILYDKLQSFLDDMKLEHQEKRILYQGKLKSTQQEFIRSQMTGFFNYSSAQSQTQDFFPRERTASIEQTRQYTPIESGKYSHRRYNPQYETMERKTLTPPPVMRRSPTHSPDFNTIQPQLTDRTKRKPLVNSVKPTPPAITRPKSNTIKKSMPKSTSERSSNGYFVREKFMQDRFKPFEPQNKPPKSKRPGRKQKSGERKSRTPLESHSNNVEKEYSPNRYRAEFDGSMELIGPPINYNNLIAKISYGNASKVINYRSASDISEMNFSNNEIRSKLPQIGQRSPGKGNLGKYDY